MKKIEWKLLRLIVNQKKLSYAARQLKSADTKTELLGRRLKTLTDVSPDHVTTRERPRRVGHGTRPLLENVC